MFLSIVLSATVGFQASFGAYEELNPKRDFVVVGDTAYALLPPHMVAEGRISDLSWSSDGRYLMFTRQPRSRDYEQLLPNPKPVTVEERAAQDVRTLCIWDSTTRRTAEVYKYGQEDPPVFEAQWLNGANQILAITFLEDPNGTDSVRYVLHRILPDGQSAVVATYDSPRGKHLSADFVPSPIRPFAIMTLTLRAKGVKPSMTHLIVRSDTDVLTPIRGGDDLLDAFDKAGRPSMIKVVEDPATHKKAQEHLLVNEATGDLTLTSEPFVPAEDPRATMPLRLQPGLSHLTSGKAAANLEVLWLKPSREPNSGAVVGTESAESELAPPLNEVAYESRGYLYARQIVALPLDFYKKLLAQYERQEAMSRAKQIALATLMYANDYDDKYPPSSDFANAIDPYLKASDMLEGFHYSLNGQNAGSIDQPASTVMGYIQMSDGQVVAYADGHVKWVPK